MLNGAVGYQLLDDGTPVSIGLLLISSIIIFIGTGYIALDTGLGWTGYWDSTLKAQASGLKTRGWGSNSNLQASSFYVRVSPFASQASFLHTRYSTSATTFLTPTVPYLLHRPRGS